MEARELRLNNLIQFGAAKEVGIVKGIWGDIYLEGGGYLEIKDVEPIPLTEDWLLKFGFKKETWTYKEQSICKIWNHENDNMPIIGDDLILDGIDHRPLIYVHQLQNLYFALTGEELELK